MANKLARLEGGDIVWLSDNLCAIGITLRTSLSGFDEYSSIHDVDVQFVKVEMPWAVESAQLIHLSSVLSVLAPNVLLADISYLPKSFVEFLKHRGFTILELPEDERITLGANVLSLGGEQVIILGDMAESGVWAGLK